MRMTVTESIRMEDGEHIGKLVEVNSKSGKNSKTGNMYEFLELKFKLSDLSPEVKYDTVSGFCPNRLTIGEQTFKWLTALNGGAEFAKGEAVDPQDFIGKSCRVIVESKPGSKNKEVLYSKVVNVLPLKKGQQEQQEQQEQQAQKQQGQQAQKPANTDAEFGEASAKKEDPNKQQMKSADDDF
jgi:hypothetical protein